MKLLKTFKLISVVFYLLIIAMGQMIGLPFFFWLLYTVFDFGNIDQLFAFLAIYGLTISYVTRNSTRTSKILFLDIVCFLLLASPIIRRMTVVPINLFNYLGFIIPTLTFSLFYLISIGYSIKQYLQVQKTD